MPNLSEAVPMSFVIETVVLIFIMIGIGIAAVIRAKKRKEQE